MVVAAYGGFALVNSLLCAEGYRVRLLEKLIVVGSWFICIIWVWEFLTKGIFFGLSFVLVGVLPQLFWVSFIRDSRKGRFLISLSILVGLFLERFYLISPDRDVLPSLGVVDYGLISFSVGFYLLFYFGLRRFAGCFLDDDGAFFGDVDGSEMEADISATEAAEQKKKVGYTRPFTSEEFRTIRLPVLLGILAMLIFVLCCLHLSEVEDLSLISILPLTYPVVALVAGIALWVRSGVFREISSRVLWVIVLFCLVMGTISGIFFVAFTDNPKNVPEGTRMEAVK